MPLYYHHIHGLEVLMGVLATGEDALLGGKRFDISLPAREASPLGVVRVAMAHCRAAAAVLCAELYLLSFWKCQLSTQKSVISNSDCAVAAAAASTISTTSSRSSASEDYLARQQCTN
jgi:hypothetical protein